MRLDPLRNLFSGIFPKSSRSRRIPGARRRTRPTLPAMESLEVRSLLSVYMVTNLNDNFFGSAGDGSLRGEVEAAPSNATIEFSPNLAGGTIVLNQIPLKLAHNITIIGPTGGIAIDANGKLPDLQVNPTVTASVSGLTFTGGGYPGPGGGPYGVASNGGGVNNYGNLSLTDCIVSGNSSNGDGGGIVNHGTLSLTGCTVSNNTSNGGGGGIVSYGNLTLTGCTVSGNLAHGNGGGIDNQGGILTLTGTTFNNDQTYGNGGGLYTNAGTVNINSSTFEYGFLGGSGGGIDNKGAEVTVTGSSFFANNDFVNGGAIDNESGGNLTLSNTSLSGNEANNGGAIFNVAGASVTITRGTFSRNSASGFGGDIANAGTLTVTGVTFDGGGSGGDGGAIENTGTLILSASTVSDTNADNGGGVANEGTGTAKLINSTFAQESAGGSGGGVYNSGGTLLATNCTISQSSASTGGGVAVASSAGVVTLANTLVAGNTGAGGSTSDVNGAVIAKYSLVGNTTGLTLLSGSSHDQLNVNANLLGFASFGGSTETYAILPGSPAIDAGSDALAVDASGNPLITDQRGGVFQRISGASVDIGAYEYETFNLVITTTSDEDDGNYGAGHLSLREAAYLASQNFVGTNTITFDPTVFATPQTIALNPSLGPIILDGSTVITGPTAGVTVSGNNTGRELEMSRDDEFGPVVSITNLTFTGGGVYYLGSGTLTLSNCDFIDNVNTTGTDTNGGGLEIHGTLMATDCTFTGNSAVEGGGLFNAGMATLVGCQFTDNQAVDDGSTPGVGGGVYNGGQLTASDTNFVGNLGMFSGGGIASPATLDLSGCNLIDNTTEGSGGGVDTERIGSGDPTFQQTEQNPGYGTVSLTGCTLSGNDAAFGGGINAWSTVDLTDCTLASNSATFGGAIDSNGVYGIGLGTLNVSGCTFTGNVTAYDGGAILDYGITSVTGSTFADNSAAGAGRRYRCS